MIIHKVEATVIHMPWTETFRGGRVGNERRGSGSAMLEDIKSILAPLVLGENPFDMEKITNQLDLATMLEKRNPAKAALDLALHDLIGKIAGMPLYRYLGGQFRTEVPDLTDAGSLIKSDSLAAAAITIPGVGGIHRSRQLVHAFEAANIPCVIGSFLEMGITTAAQLHLTTAMRNFTYPVDILGSFGFHESTIIHEQLQVAPGFAAVCPPGDGLGVALHEERVRQYTVSDTFVATL